MLEAPQESYAPGSQRRRRGGTASPERKLRRDLSEDFADPAYEDDAPAVRRRGGVRVRFGVLPRSRWGWIAAIALLLLLGGAGAGIFITARSFVLHDERFVIPTSSAIQFNGNAHVTRTQLLTVFGEDVERNIFRVPLAERRLEVEQMPWVAHATVMRLLPNRLRISIVERTPVAFVREGSRIGLVDVNGVLLGAPIQAKGEAPYSFPVVTGILAGDPLSTRAARMKIYERFTSELDSAGEKIAQGLNEVDLSDPEDVKALVPDHSADILVHFGDADFLDRYQRFEQHLPEWRTMYPKLSSVDMRYERQVVLEMQPGAGVPMTTSTNPAGAAAPSAETSHPAAVPAAGDKPAPATSAAQAALAKHLPGAPKSLSAKPAAHASAHSATAYAATTKRTARTPATRVKGHPAAAKPHTVAVKHGAASPRYHAPQAVHP